MKLTIEWNRPVRPTDGREHGLIYSVDLEKLPEDPGVYVFIRQLGTSFGAIYVGKANNIRSRVKRQLNNLRLMQRIKRTRANKRMLLVGRYVGKPGQREDKALLLIERSLIRHFLSEGHDLSNIQGTLVRQHEVTSNGKHPKKLIPKSMYLEKTRRA